MGAAAPAHPRATGAGMTYDPPPIPLGIQLHMLKQSGHMWELQGPGVIVSLFKEQPDRFWYVSMGDLAKGPAPRQVLDDVQARVDTINPRCSFVLLRVFLELGGVVSVSTLTPEPSLPPFLV